MDGNKRNTGPRNSRKRLRNKNSASASKKRMKSSNLTDNSNNKVSNQPKSSNVDSLLPETLQQSLSTRFSYDKLPSQAEAQKIFKFMTNHKPLPAEVSLLFYAKIREKSVLILSPQVRPLVGLH